MAEDAMATDMQRLARAADKLEIIEALTRYHHAIDFLQWDDLDAVLAPDAVGSWAGMGAEMGLDTDAPSGRDAIKAWLKGAVGERRSLHYMVNHVVDVDGDEAANRSMVAVADALSNLYHVGYYDGTHRRTPEGWRITALHFTRAESAKRRSLAAKG
jgi:hypothetical protein